MSVIILQVKHFFIVNSTVERMERVMNKCVGIEGKVCGFEFDPGLEFPDDTLCDGCFDEMAEEVTR